MSRYYLSCNDGAWTIRGGRNNVELTAASLGDALRAVQKDSRARPDRVTIERTSEYWRAIAYKDGAEVAQSSAPTLSTCIGGLWEQVDFGDA